MQRTHRPNPRGSALWPLVALLAIGVTGCDSILETEDPDVVTPEQLTGPSAVPIRTAGVVADFAEAFDGHVLYTGLFTDEFILAGTFPTRREVDERAVLISNSTITDFDAGNEDGIYESTHTARFSADEGLRLFTEAQQDPAFEDVQSELLDGLAVASLYAGYSRVLLAEAWCQSILGGPEGESAPLGSDERMREALGFLQEAETRAADAGREDLGTAARVGQARAHLWLREFQQAADVAATVETDFLYRAEYSSNSNRQENEVFKFTWGMDGEALRWTVGNGDVPQRHDELYAYYDEWVSLGLIIPPDQNDLEPFGGTGVPISAQVIYGPASAGGQGSDADIVLASGWEARMIEAENLLRTGDAAGAEAIVNPLLADPAQNPINDIHPSLPAGAFQPVEFTGDLQADLAELARARQAGLWLTGERLTTSRRFLEDGVDLYPTGTQGDQIAFPVVEQELNNNPNINTACPSGFPGI